MRITRNLTPFAFGIAVALMTGLVGQQAQNFQEQERCHAHYAHTKLEGGPKTHTLLQHRSFFGETFYCVPLYEVR